MNMTLVYLLIRAAHGKEGLVKAKLSKFDEINEIYVGNGDSEDFFMSCAPTETGTYDITIGAERGIKTRETTVRLVTSDYNWKVEPIDE